MTIQRWTLVLLLGWGPLAFSAPDKVDAFMRAEMARGHIPGAAVAVIRDGKVIKQQAYGTANLEWSAPATTRSAFQIASGTKMFTAVLLMDLVGQGKIRLEDPISRYIPDSPPAWSKITVRQLASHTSGLKPGPPNAQIASVASAVEEAKKLPLASAPGEKAAYGSDDFTILTHLLEKVGGAPYRQLLRDRITTPLGMSNTRFDNAAHDAEHIVLTSDVVPERVATYQWQGDHQQQYWFVYPHYTLAAGGLFSSITDMSRFMSALMTGKLLNAELRTAMGAPAPLNDGAAGSFAVGWTVGRYRGRANIGHSGGPALSDTVYFPDDKLAVVVLTNQRKLSPNLAHGVANFYLPPPPFLNEPGITDPAPARTATLKQVLEALARGAAEARHFTGPAKEDLKEMNEWMAMRLGGFPPLGRLVLLSASTDHKKRTYRAVYGKDLTQRWTVTFDPTGLISEVDATDE
ncbi:serine hydrolase domain-containing protein [Corallococcus terminator]|uniref:Class A beta-lactamase-related serine hydrolase n=1 Tax=Corallococcus terminator TaxID=2316733 RepID=A0A3A8HS73_9BACT|nr:serine hydrolase domain-containing protein [Corallococcus terminator]RKG70394.1 class A beta-lactamase-related serine hydrolase [Corallococcus terminator]